MEDLTMSTHTPVALECATCRPPNRRLTFFEQYRGFLLSTNTLITVLNGLLLLAGFVASLAIDDRLPANVLYIASALLGGAPIFVLAAHGIARLDLTAGVMVSVAMIAALLIGEYSAAALVAFMMMFGELLENLAVARSDNALKELASLIPAQVILLLQDGEKVMGIEQVRLGDQLLVRNGERIPVDGVVRDGQAAVDEAAITGESLPVDKAAGDKVYAGTINTAGTLVVEAEKLGRDTTLGTIVRLVEEAQRTQAPTQRLANRYARILVPVTFAVAIAVYLITGELVRSVTVLVVVCPCALVLATPTALVAAIGNAARNNVIVKTGAHMEMLGKIDVVAFDKTGTLTLGRPEVVQVTVLDGASPDDVLMSAASAERASEHPLGRAIVRAATGRGLSIPPAETSQVLTGFGVEARSGGSRVLVGSLSLLTDRGIALSAEEILRLVELERVGHTVVPVAVNGRVAGLISLADAIRPEAARTIRELKAVGVRETVMISGDNEATVQAVAGQVGVGRHHGRMLPEQKLRLIQEMKSRGLTVAYVGDGVNDAPALAVADIGIAMGAAGTDLAIETSDVALMGDDMERLPQLVALSRETLRTIRVSVIFSMSMNLLSVVLGMLGIIGPAFGAVMHELSALPVLAYSARLVAYRYRQAASPPAVQAPSPETLEAY
jgi:heavy metal translocating P-type ATPase